MNTIYENLDVKLNIKKVINQILYFNYKEKNMFKIIGGKGTGKTRELLTKAHDEGAVVLCMDTEKMQERARGYGFYNMDIRGYPDIFKTSVEDKDVYIHDVDAFLHIHFGLNVKGYSATK